MLEVLLDFWHGAPRLLAEGASSILEGCTQGPGPYITSLGFAGAARILDLCLHHPGPLDVYFYSIIIQSAARDPDLAFYILVPRRT